MTEFSQTEQHLINRARSIEIEAKNLRKAAESSRQSRVNSEEYKRQQEAIAELREAERLEKARANSYTNRAAVRGTPEWNRETMLTHERQLQADADRAAMFRDGMNKLVDHVRRNASIYSAVLVVPVSVYNPDGTVEVRFKFRAL